MPRKGNCQSLLLKEQASAVCGTHLDDDLARLGRLVFDLFGRSVSRVKPELSAGEGGRCLTSLILKGALASSITAAL